MLLIVELKAPVGIANADMGVQANVKIFLSRVREQVLAFGENFEKLSLLTRSSLLWSSSLEMD